jgi:hypothetical protein
LPAGWKCIARFPFRDQFPCDLDRKHRICIEPGKGFPIEDRLFVISHYAGDFIFNQILRNLLGLGTVTDEVTKADDFIDPGLLDVSLTLSKAS